MGCVCVRLKDDRLDPVPHSESSLGLVVSLPHSAQTCRTDFTEGPGVLDTSDRASADLGAGSVHCKDKEGDSGGLGTPGLILVIC